MTFLYLTTRLRKSLLISFILSFLFIYTAQAQLLVKDVANTTLNALPNSFVEMGGIVYFLGSDAVNGEELWRTDGTESGTYLVKDIWPGTSPSNISGLTVMNSKLYFSANNNADGVELWISDGTTSGTELLADIKPGGATDSSSPNYLVVMNGYLYFSATNLTSGNELWRSDGIVGGTTELVADIRSGAGSSVPKYLTVYNNELFFQANDGSTGREVWKSDGTVGNASQIFDIRSGTGSSTPTDFTIANDLLFFQADDGSVAGGKELYVTNGIVDSVSVLEINPTSDSNPSDFYAFNNKLYLSADDGSGDELWQSDGTTITKLASVVPSNFFEWSGSLYFKGYTIVKGYELWKTDGTAPGTALFVDIYTGNNHSSPADFTPYGGKLFFTATDVSNGKEVWMTDGTAVGTELAMDVYEGSTASGASELTLANGMLFFAATDATEGNAVRLIGNCDVSLAPVRKDAGTHYSLFEKTDGNGWTHYCDCANNVLLSLEKGGTGAVIPSDGVSVKIEATTVEHHASGCVTGDCFISASGGAVVFNRSWDVSPTTQPTSDIPVRFYFSSEEYDEVNTEMGNQSMIPLTDPDQMSFFKVTEPSLGSHPAVEDVTSADVIVLAHDGGAPAAPSLTTWVKTSFGSDYYAEFLVSSFSGGGGGAGSGGASLPVEMMYFWARAIPSDNEVHMEWSTASEINNYGFIIERSFDLNNWEGIGFVESNGGATSPSVNVYQFVDDNPKPGTNYYRLHQRDYDGAEDYSEVVHVKFDVELIGDVYPNPVSQSAEVQIDITTSGPGPGTVEVYDISRQLLIKNQYDLKSGQQLLPLNINGLPTGMYIVKVEARGAVVNTKLLIQE